MTITYITGDLVNAKESVIIHGCNAKGVMGAGVAKAVRAKYPEAYEDYRAVHESTGLELGEVYWTWLNYPTGLRVIGNAITQQSYGHNGRYVDYDAVTSVFERSREFVEKYASSFDMSKPVIAISKIGATLGGGDWDEISQRIVDAMGDHPAVCYSLT